LSDSRETSALYFILNKIKYRFVKIKIFDVIWFYQLYFILLLYIVASTGYNFSGKWGGGGGGGVKKKKKKISNY